MKILDNKAVSANYWKLIEKFNNKLNKLEHLTYNICKEIEFDIEMKNIDNKNKCKQYQLEREKSEYNFITKFSKNNDIDLGAVLSDLPHVLIY